MGHAGAVRGHQVDIVQGRVGWDRVREEWVTS